MNYLLTNLLLCLIYFSVALAANSQSASSAEKPLTVVMAGLSHGHSSWIFNRKETDVQIVGIYEPNPVLVKQFSERYKLDESLFYSNLEEMLNKVKPSGLLAFGSIYDHLEAVREAAPRGIHVMVEKPLAVSQEHSEEMADLARTHQIHLLTNYETSWYPTTTKTKKVFEQEPESMGEIRKMVFHHGHKGPKEIGVGKEFLDWLTDPKLNGGGALVDFGCYGANIMTYLMKGQRPTAVTAVTRTFKPETYPNVDDQVTIIVDYPDAQGIIQGSWNWPFDRKDMEVYGERGYVITKDAENMRLRSPETNGEIELKANAEELGVYRDPFSYFKDVIEGKLKFEKYDLYSLENNLMVVEILEAAKKSAATGMTVKMENE